MAVDPEDVVEVPEGAPNHRLGHGLVRDQVHVLDRDLGHDQAHVLDHDRVHVLDDPNLRDLDDDLAHDRVPNLRDRHHPVRGIARKRGVKS